MKKWFDIQNSTQGAKVYIHDEIGGWGINARQFISQLDALGDAPVTLHINSPGGSVFDALAIFNHLKNRDVTVHIDGLAASAASIIAMAGSRILMPENTFMMIHDPWGVVAGNAEEMREMADVLERLGEALVATYRARTGMDEDALKQMLAEETWLDAAQAVELGFADEVLPALKVAASYDRPVPEHVLAALKGKGFNNTEEGEPVTDKQHAPGAQDIQSAVSKALEEAKATVAMAIEAGVPNMAASLIGLDMDTAKARIEAAGEIRKLCEQAGFADKAEGFISQGLDVDAVRARLFDLMVAKSKMEDVDAHHTDRPQVKPLNEYSAAELADIYRNDPALYQAIINQQ